mmetsp:Transcript_87470/g.127905  ORF Transcript_87470/g.127905 Transcript_87470/m.127905 type:complete len:114 (+) Transcript_87470:79-420(+)
MCFIILVSPRERDSCLLPPFLRRQASYFIHYLQARLSSVHSGRDTYIRITHTKQHTNAHAHIWHTCGVYTINESRHKCTNNNECLTAHRALSNVHSTQTRTHMHVLFPYCHFQ